MFDHGAMRSGAAPSSSTPDPVPTAGATALDALAERIRPLALRRDDHLPVLPALTRLLPGEGLRRGTTVSVAGDAGGGATSLALALVAATSRAGRSLIWVMTPRSMPAELHTTRMSVPDRRSRAASIKGASSAMVASRSRAIGNNLSANIASLLNKLKLTCPDGDAEAC